MSPTCAPIFRYWPCQGIFVGTERHLTADVVRNIGAMMATHTITTFLDGDDIAGPQVRIHQNMHSHHTLRLCGAPPHYTAYQRSPKESTEAMERVSE